MADRNNELLLALGFRLETREGRGGISIRSTRWVHSDGREFPENFNPRGNLQDAVNCVPEGLEWMAGIKERDGKMYGFAYLYRAGQSVQPIIKVRDCPTPHEALSEAIAKAVTK